MATGTGTSIYLGRDAGCGHAQAPLGSHFPNRLLESRRRLGAAQTSVVAICYLLGVSTQRMENGGWRPWDYPALASQVSENGPRSPPERLNREIRRNIDVVGISRPRRPDPSHRQCPCRAARPIGQRAPIHWPRRSSRRYRALVSDRQEVRLIDEVEQSIGTGDRDPLAIYACTLTSILHPAYLCHRPRCASGQLQVVPSAPEVTDAYTGRLKPQTTNIHRRGYSAVVTTSWHGA
jgi:hypothetical protein